MALSMQISHLRSILAGYESTLKKFATKNRTLTAGISLSLPLALFVVSRFRRSYNDYIALGPGGLPYNTLGWSIHILLCSVALNSAQARDPSIYDALITTETPVKAPSLKLTEREGERPTIKGTIPHRQTDQLAPPELREHIQTAFAHAIQKRPGKVYLRKSLYERHNDGVFVTEVCTPQAELARGECGHLHGDLSGHFWFSDEDAREIVGKGWGERHPLAVVRGGGVFRLGPGYLMVYAARDEGEVEVFEELVGRSMGFLGGKI